MRWCAAHKLYGAKQTLDVHSVCCGHGRASWVK